MEYIVEMAGIIKHYQVTKRIRSGLWGAVKGLVKREYHTVRAVDGGTCLRWIPFTAAERFWRCSLKGV